MSEEPHEHSYHCMPASDPDNELPLYCPICLDEESLDRPGGVMWGDGTLMSINQWNAYYDQNGNLLDPNDDPSVHNKIDDE